MARDLYRDLDPNVMRLEDVTEWIAADLIEELVALLRSVAGACHDQAERIRAVTEPADRAVADLAEMARRTERVLRSIDNLAKPRRGR